MWSRAALLIVGLLCGCSAQSSRPNFREDIEPLLMSACIRCHDENHIQLNLYDHPRRTLIDKGLISPGDPEMSPFFLRVRDGHPERTPLPEQQVVLIKHWIASGAP